MENDRILLELCIPSIGLVTDIDVSLDMTVTELILSINETYNLQLNDFTIANAYIRCKKPVNYMKGNHMLSEYKIWKSATLELFF